MHITEELIEITPEIAEEMLRNNPINRTIKSKRVNKYAREIQSGKWTATPTPISISPSGRLLDGQHRLLAVIKAGIPIKAPIAYDVPEDTVFDRGAERDTGDALFMRGVIDKDVSSRRVISVIYRYFSICGNNNPSDSEMADFINQNHDNILLAIDISRAGASRAICDKAGVQTAILAALMRGVDSDRLYAFTRCTNTGFMNSASDSPAVLLRNYIFGNPQTGQTASERLAAYSQMCIRDYVGNVVRHRKYSNPQHIYINS